MDGPAKKAGLFGRPATQSAPEICPPREPHLASSSSAAQAYQAYRAATDLGEPYRLPRSFLAGTKPYPGPDVPEAPLIALVNARAGGRAGPALAAALYRAIGAAQVFELGACEDGGAAPGPVLEAVLSNLDAAAARGDPVAAHLRARLVVLVAGGDGTVAWVLGTLADLASKPGSPPPPPVAILPLGTGNDLALSFGWGTRFRRAWVADHAALYATLERIARGGVRDLDTWRIVLSRDGATPDDAFPSLPHSLDKADTPAPSATGRFWNYFSLGPDAGAAHGFHSLRERRPWAAPGRLINRLWYGVFSCFSGAGWYCGGAPISTRVRLRAKRPNAAGGADTAAWVDVPIPPGVKGIAILNLQSYAGGSDHWGLRDGAPPPPGAVCGGGGLGPGAAVARSEDVWLPAADSGLPAPVSGGGGGGNGATTWSQPIFNDGLVEVIGFKSGWHFGATMAGLSPSCHAVRLAQAAEIQLECSAGPAGGCGGDGRDLCMQVDGEPWRQPLPEPGEPPLVITVRHEGAARMLFNGVRLAGVAPKIRRLAERERTVSLGVQRRLTSTASLAAEAGGGVGGRGSSSVQMASRLGGPAAAVGV